MNEKLKDLNLIKKVILEGYKDPLPFISFDNDNSRGIFPFFKYENALTAIIIPGGGFDFVSILNEGIFIAKEFNKKGINAIVLSYGIKEKAKYPLPIFDLVEAYKFLEKYGPILNVDCKNYIVLGSSAGAFLTLSFSRKDIGYHFYKIKDTPKALILSYPLVSLKDNLTHKGSRDNVIGSLKKDIEKENLYSNEDYIDNDFPPCFIWCFNNDELVNSLNSRILKEKLDEKGIKNELIIYEGNFHGVGLGRYTPSFGWFNLALDFIKKNVK